MRKFPIILLFSIFLINTPASVYAREATRSAASKLCACCKTLGSKLDEAVEIVSADFSSTTTVINQLIADASCEGIQISQDDVVDGVLTISVPETYCFAGDIVANLVITVSNVIVDFNNNNLFGTVHIDPNFSSITLQNGTVQAPAPLSAIDALAPAIFVGAGSQAFSMTNVEVICADSVAPGVNGRTGVTSASPNAVIQLCIIHAGAGSSNGVVGDGGIGFNNTGSALQMDGCIIQGGDGGSVSAKGGNGGFGMVNTSDSVSLSNLNVYSGNGGIGFVGGDSNAGLFNSGIGLLLTSCVITSGNGGNSSSGGKGGNSGDAITNSAPSFSWNYCNLSTGNGGNGNPAGNSGSGLRNSGNSAFLTGGSIIAGNGGNGTNNVLLGVGGNGGNGGDAITNTGSFFKVVGARFNAGHGGNGGNGTEGTGGGNGGNGGISFNGTGANEQILKSYFLSGDGGVGGNGGNSSSVAAGNGGNGGNGGSTVKVAGGLGVYAFTFLEAGNAGNGGNGGNGLGTQGGNGGKGGNGGHDLEIVGGDVYDVSGNIIYRAGTAGTGGLAGTGLPNGVPGSNGVGGDGVRINGPVSNAQIHDSRISQIPGKAINDLSNPSSSKIFSNFAYDVQSVPQYLLGANSAGDAPNGTPFFAPNAGISNLQNIYKS